jgi:putative flippase GtrA
MKVGIARRTQMLQWAWRYASVGVLVTGLHVVVAMAWIHGIGDQPVMANGMAFCVAALVGFLVNTRWSFSTQMSRNVFARYLTVTGLVFVLTLVVSAAGHRIGLSPLGTTGLVALTTPPVSFALHALWTYRIPGQRDPALTRDAGELDIKTLVLMAAILACARWPSINYPLPLNVDESQALANVLRMAATGIGWANSDGTTVGPLNSLVLGWPQLLNLDATFWTMRMTALTLIVVIFASMMYGLGIWLGRARTRVVMIVPTCIYALSAHADMLHYSSELLSLALLGLANALILRLAHSRAPASTAQAWLLGLSLGAVPFAKLQAAPIAAAMLAGGFFVTGARRWPQRQQLNVLVASMLPGALLLAPLLLRHEFNHFWLSYIAWAGLYVKASLSLDQFNRLLAAEPIVQTAVYALIGIAGLACSSLALSRLARINSASKPDEAPWLGVLSYSALLCAISLWACTKPGNMFPHYLQLFLPWLIQFTAIAWADASKGGGIAIQVTPILILGTAIASIRPPWQDFQKAFDKVVGNVPESHFNRPQLWGWIVPDGSPLLVWGWMPHWYVWADARPATRETHTYAQIVASSLQGYFRQRWLADWDKTPPFIVLDAVHGASFGFHNADTEGPKIFEEFQRRLSAGFTRISPQDADPNCAVLYVRSELAQGFLDRRVQPASVVAKVDGLDVDKGTARLFDLSLTEDSCSDYWLLPHNRLGSLDITLQRSEAIAEIRILNTGNSQGRNRMSTRLSLQFLQRGRLVHQAHMSLKPHPYWTVLPLPASIDVDHIHIDILEFAGRGAGLNEILLLRPDGHSAPVRNGSTPSSAVRPGTGLLQ